VERRSVLKNLSAAAIVPVLPKVSFSYSEHSERKFLHSVCRWCYNKYPLEELCDAAKEIGIQSVELLNPSEWDIVLNRGLKVALSNGSSLGITKGWNQLKYHGQLQKDLLEIIPMAADKGIQQIIVFSGNRNDIPDNVGLENCAIGLDPIVKYAGQYGVRIVMELLNSKVEHPDYQCDHTAWGVKLVDKVGSPHFKLLYDIYHMQVMEGDVINTIKTYKDYIAHYHTAGVPGRHEIDETQELYYPAIMKAIASCGFDGFVAQEFIPLNPDPWKALKDAIRICSV
jgi:hydroxypyruvate isomerase